MESFSRKSGHFDNGWEDNINMDIKEIVSVGWTSLAREDFSGGLLRKR
jgi:hypothetical protein